MKPFIFCAATIFGLVLGAWQSLASAPRPVPYIGPSDGPMPEFFCADPGPRKEGFVFKVFCHAKGTRPCSSAPQTLPLLEILQRLTSATPLGIKLKANGCYEYTLVIRRKP